MDFLKNAADSTMKAAKGAVDWDEEEEKAAKKEKEKASASKTKKDDDDDILSIDSEEAEEAGEIVADVFTFGMYSTVANSVGAYEKYEEKKKMKAKKAGKGTTKDDDSVGSDEMELAGEVTANVFTMGMYTDVKDGIEEYQKEQEEEQKKKEEAEKTA